MSEKREKQSYYCNKDGKDLFDYYREGLLTEEQFDGFCFGTIIKYLKRKGIKDPFKKKEDLLKARDYLDQMIEVCEEEEKVKATINYTNGSSKK